jgi:hypothetical protein
MNPGAVKSQSSKEVFGEGSSESSSGTKQTGATTDAPRREASSSIGAGFVRSFLNQSTFIYLFVHF